MMIIAILVIVLVSYVGVLIYATVQLAKGRWLGSKGAFAY